MAQALSPANRVIEDSRRKLLASQISDNVHVLNSESYGQTCYGIHPGTGSANSVVEHCYGISIGHKDTDNEFSNNTIARNGVSGVYFREETAENSGHRNTFRNNKVLDNGSAKAGYGFYIARRVNDTLIAGNEIRDAHGHPV